MNHAHRLDTCRSSGAWKFSCACCYKHAGPTDLFLLPITRAHSRGASAIVRRSFYSLANPIAAKLKAPHGNALASNL